jgi:two-component sensor histidine kinase
MGSDTCSNNCMHLTEVDHRVANHFALLRSFVALKAGEVRNARDEPSRLSTLLLLDGIAARLDAFASVHRSLARDRGVAEANLAEHLHNICAAYQLSVPENISIQEAFDAGCALSFERLFCLTQIFSELLTNAIKYAPIGHAHSVIRASCTERADRAIIIDVIDDGCGLPPAFNFDVHGGLGIRLIKALTKQLGASVEFNQTSHGLHARLCVPFRSNGLAAASTEIHVRDKGQNIAV